MNKLFLIQIVKDIESIGLEKTLEKYSAFDPRLAELSSLVNSENLTFSDILDILVKYSSSKKLKGGTNGR